MILGVLAASPVGGLTCSRSGLLPAPPDASVEQQPMDARAAADGAVPDAQVERQAAADATSGDPTTRGRCGNARVTADEACDDGNEVSGDGCSADCKGIEPGFHCRAPGRRCVPICGDGLLVGWEASLDTEPSCRGSEQAGSICGDGLVTHYEECDCGTAIGPLPADCVGPNGDGYGECTPRCTWGPFCGDGVVNGPDEECDLGSRNGAPGRNGCTVGCKTPHYCGDRMIDSLLGEECDLGELNGVRLDLDGKPSNGPDARVVCHTDCTIAIVQL